MDKKKIFNFIVDINAKSCEQRTRKYWVHRRNKSKKSRISCLYVFLCTISCVCWFFSSDVRIGCMACPAVVNSKQQLNISAVYSMWVFITIKAQVNVKSGTKTQIERRDEKRKKNKCLLFINSYKTCICYVQCDAYKVNRSLLHVRLKQEHFCSCFSFFLWCKENDANIMWICVNAF